MSLRCPSRFSFFPPCISLVISLILSFFLSRRCTNSFFLRFCMGRRVLNVTVFFGDACLVTHSQTRTHIAPRRKTKDFFPFRLRYFFPPSTDEKYEGKEKRPREPRGQKNHCWHPWEKKSRSEQARRERKKERRNRVRVRRKRFTLSVSGRGSLLPSSDRHEY